VTKLPFTFKSIVRRSEEFLNSNISPCKIIIFKESSKRNQNPSSYYNLVTNLKFPSGSLYNQPKGIGYKVRRYWEHVGEHIGNNTKSNTPQKKKTWDLLDACGLT
jgi:hypothetical protein